MALKARLCRLSVLALAGSMVAACTGSITDPGQGATGTGAGPGTGTGGAIGTPGSGGAIGTPGSGGAIGTPGSGGSVSPGSGGTGAGGAVVSMPGTFDLEGSPAYLRFVRLTNEQWARSVQDLLGLTAPSGLEANFLNAVSGTTDFTNNEQVLNVTQRNWSDFQAASETLATQATATDAALAKVYTGTDAAGFISSFGRRVYRRPLTTAEKSTYMTLWASGSTLVGSRSAFAKGASLVIRAMLQSPNFLYRTELGAKGAALTGYEMAAKLSLWLRGTTPNDALLDSAAGPGKLETAAGAMTLATTMLDEPAATAVMRHFHGELLHFDRYLQITKVGVSNYKESLNTELQESSYLFFDKIFSKGLGLKEILTSTSGFVGPGMAPLYEGGIAAPASGFVEKDLGAKRVGYFSQLPFLTLYAHNADPGSIKRGVSLNLDVLCAVLGPPATVIPDIPDRKAGQTSREAISELTGTCGQACHNQMINPLGFAFEHYDGMGKYRDTEKNMTQDLPIDSTGSFSFIEGTKSFTGAADLMQLMASGQQAHLCYSKKMSSFALQRDVVAGDMPLLTSLAATSMASGGSVKQMMLGLVKNDAFRMRGAQ